MAAKSCVKNSCPKKTKFKAFFPLNNFVRKAINRTSTDSISAVCIYDTEKEGSTHKRLCEAVVEAFELAEEKLGEVDELDVLGNGDEALAVDDLSVKNENVTRLILKSRRRLKLGLAHAGNTARVPHFHEQFSAFPMRCSNSIEYMAIYFELLAKTHVIPFLPAHQPPSNFE